MPIIIFVMIYSMKIKIILIVYGHILSRELQFRHDWEQTCWKQCEMGVDIKLYRARIGLFNIRQCKLPVNSNDINIVRIAHTWFFGIISAVTLMIWGVELNPGLQTRKADWIHTGIEKRDERYVCVGTKEIHFGHNKH
jgi:hypothetical protein